MPDEFYDQVYEEWRSGGNPDSLSIDDYDDHLSRGYDPEDYSQRMESEDPPWINELENLSCEMENILPGELNDDNNTRDNTSTRSIVDPA